MFIARRLGWRSIGAQLSAAAVLCAALGSFIGSAASAVRPEVAMLRGAGAGFLFGLGIGILNLAIVALWHRVARKAD